jgi:Flp pilus assembly protein TadG
VSYQDDLPELLAHEPGAGERGQTLALLVIFMLSLVGMAAMAIDVGTWYQARRSIQSAADAAALAGASQLPAGWSNAQTAAQAEFAKNSKTGDSAVYSNVTVNASSDSVTVTATRPTASYFAKEFGIGDPNISATARATVLAYTNVVSTGQVMPWGVMKSSWVLGSQYSLYVDNSTPNNGALALPVKDSAGTCQSTSGASDYKNSIIGPPNGNIACDVSVGEVVGVKTGQNSGPTSQGIDTRITSWDPLTAIVQMTSNGQAIILKPNSLQLLLLPVVEDMAGGSTWPSGSGNVKVIGFAYFVITYPGYTNNGKTVVGTFVGLQSGNTGWTTGPWTPGSSTAFTIELTG